MYLLHRVKKTAICVPNDQLEKMQDETYATISADNKVFELMENKAYAGIGGENKSFETKKEAVTYETVDLID